MSNAGQPGMAHEIHRTMGMGLAALVAGGAGRAFFRMFGMLAKAGDLLPRVHELTSSHHEEGCNPENSKVFQTDGHCMAYR